MLVCLACPRQAHLPPTHDDHDHPHAAALGKSSAVLGPSKEHIKSFTTQLKDIVMKFSSGAYRHCRPCTAAAVRGGVADEDDQNCLYMEDDEKSSILLGSNSEDQAMSDHAHRSLLHEDEYGAPYRLGDSSPTASSRYDLLPMARSKRHHHRHKKKTNSSVTSSSTSTLTLKRLPSNPESCDAIEQLLNAHFLREQMILAEEQLAVIRDDEQLLDVENRGDHRLLEEAQLVSRERHIEEHIDDDDGHVKRSKRHMNVDSSGNFEEWVAQVEPGVMITFVALPDGSNHLKRIRFSRELFSKWQAQLWWAENSDMVRELYSVSKSEAPFKSCSSARSSSSISSSTTSSSHHDHQHALLNTPELQSRVGSSQSSPSRTHLIIDAVENKAHSSPEPCSPCAHLSPEPSSPCICVLAISHSLGSLSDEMVDRHDNPLYDSPELEMCNHEGVKGPLMVQRMLWASTVQRHAQLLQQDANDDDVGDDPNALAGELVRELKRVRFITQ